MVEWNDTVQTGSREPRTSASVLHVDDHALFVAGLAYLLEQLPFALDLTQIGTRAEMVDVLGRRHFDLILVDLILPDASGSEMISTAVALAGDAPVVALSMMDRPEAIRGAIEHGAAGFIPKHSRPEVLLNAIGLVMAGGIYLPPALLSSASRPARRPGTEHPPERTAAALTDRQRQVLSLVVEGRANRDIARLLGVSEATVKAHMTAIMRAVGAHNRTQAVIAALDSGIV